MTKSLQTGPICESSRLYLRHLRLYDDSDAYLSWLNDSEVQKYSRRRNRKSSREDLKKFLMYVQETADLHLAICLKESHKHIGNISLNALDDLNKNGEISIMMGDRSEWSKGYGSEAVKLLTQYSFEKLMLHRLWAESPNPAFNSLMKKCGWIHEGTRREAFFIEGQFIDLICWSLLRSEYVAKQ